MTAKAGYYYFELFDMYSKKISVVAIVVVELILVCYAYGNFKMLHVDILFLFKVVEIIYVICER